MQKQKSQSKPIETLSFQQLFRLAEQKEEEFDYDEAEYFYGLAYQKNSFNEAVVMCYANILKQNDKTKEAKQILEKSIKQNPNGTYKRYFELGEIYNGVQAIKIFQQGIKQATKHLKNPFKSVTPVPEIKRDIAQGYASIAQICMTDLIDQPQAQAKCIQALQKGNQADTTCIDIHLQIANYQLFKENFQVAHKELDLILNAVKEKKQEYDNDIIRQASKYYIQLDQFNKSMQLLQTIHQQQSNQSQVVYLLAYCAFKLKNYDQCQDLVEEYKQGTNNIKDEEIEDAMAELIVELNKVKPKGKGKGQDQMEETGENAQGDMEEDQWMDVEDQDN